MIFLFCNLEWWVIRNRSVLLEFFNGREGLVFFCILDVEEMVDDWMFDWLYWEFILLVEVLVMEVVEVFLVELIIGVELVSEDLLIEFFVVFL